MFRIGRMFLGFELMPRTLDGEFGLELSGDSLALLTRFVSVWSG